MHIPLCTGPIHTRQLSQVKLWLLQLAETPDTSLSPLSLKPYAMSFLASPFLFDRNDGPLKQVSVLPLQPGPTKWHVNNTTMSQVDEGW